MKNTTLERNLRLMRQYHLKHPWILENGLFIPHTYPVTHTDFSGWADVGFIQGGRRVLVAWTHPRYQYVNKIEWCAFDESDRLSTEPKTRICRSSVKAYKKVGRSRRKMIGYVSHEIDDSFRAYHDFVSQAEERLMREGIEHTVYPSMSVKWLPHLTLISLCCPIRVMTKSELIQLSELAKRLYNHKSTLQQEFPGYKYDRTSWLEQANSNLNTPHHGTPRHILPDLLAQCDPDAPISEELQAWDKSPPLGSELL